MFESFRMLVCDFLGAVHEFSLTLNGNRVNTPVPFGYDDSFTKSVPSDHYSPLLHSFIIMIWYRSSLIGQLSLIDELLKCFYIHLKYPCETHCTSKFRVMLAI